ncbi:hypothetical protein ACIPSE_45580 [Streptomyces sp. NPDC090106]|uniref:hypothetical protein n=1 Tax=Streptomyces sp. NPDC090106 TaxID=3365946 RepID=UPI0037FA6451
MKSVITGIELSPPRVPGRDCSAHGGKGPHCTSELAATVTLADAGSPHIEWVVCRWWIDHEPDVAAYLAAHGR